MKHCNKCKADKATGEFAKNKSKPDGLQSMCRACKKETDAKHYKENKARQLARNAANAKKYRLMVSEFKKSPCADCGVEYPAYVMDFDHVRGEKVANLSKMGGNYSWATILEEIDKCEVVCSNCHRERTHKRMGP